jgi:hypothetical protein
MAAGPSFETEERGRRGVCGAEGKGGSSRSEATGALRRKTCCPNDSKGGTLVYTHTKPGDQKRKSRIKRGQEPKPGFILSECGFVRHHILMECGHETAVFLGRTSYILGPLHLWFHNSLE